jgi:L-threonylcarbamoyladenylate synthase
MPSQVPKTTQHLLIDAARLDEEPARRALAIAAETLRRGGTVALPTETVYGLGANAFDAAAVSGIFAAKQRPAWDPLIVHVSDSAMLQRVVREIPAAAERLMAAFWPGPLTLLLPRGREIPATVTAGRDRVGVRMPAHPVARALIATAGLPIAAPSANRFGHTSPTTAQHVLDDLAGRIDAVLDAGPTQCGIESTVVEVQDGGAILYRHGAVTAETIAGIAGPVTIYVPPARDVENQQSLPSPGVGIRHYAPRAQVIPVAIAAEDPQNPADQFLAALENAGSPAEVGVLLPIGWPVPAAMQGHSFDWGAWEQPEEMAQRLFAGLRALDDLGVARIYCPLPRAAGLGAAIRDRLMKAAMR